jgi:hypothetical protein
VLFQCSTLRVAFHFFQVIAEVTYVLCTGLSGGGSPEASSFVCCCVYIALVHVQVIFVSHKLHQALFARTYANLEEARGSWSPGVLEGLSLDDVEVEITCAERAATATAIASARLLLGLLLLRHAVLKLVLVLMLVLVLIAPYLTYLTLPYPTLPYCSAFWLFLSLRHYSYYTANCISRMGLRSLWLAGFQNDAQACTTSWQLLAARKLRVQHPSGRGDPRERISHTAHSTKCTTRPSSQSYDLFPKRSQGSKQRRPCIWRCRICPRGHMNFCCRFLCPQHR